MTRRIASFAALLVLASTSAFLPGPAYAQESGSSHRLPLVEDWSTRHWIYPGAASEFSSPEQATDPRLLYAWLVGNPSWTQARREALEKAENLGELGALAHRRHRRRTDWAFRLGTNGGMPVGETPAKYSFDVHQLPSCTNDFAVFVINASPGVGSQANIIALNNLYSGPGTSYCSMLNPTTMWSYAAGQGPITTSPVLSSDGTKVAFVDNYLRGRLNVLTWQAGQGTDATTGAVAPGTGGSSLTVLDFTNIGGNPNCPVSNSTAGNASPYVDYRNDIAYVATDNGRLYKITGIFNGTPTVAYCVIVNNNKSLTSPVYDAVSGNVFISDGQKLYAFLPGATSFTSAGTPVLIASLTAHSIVLSPIVDAPNHWVYAFSGTDSTGTFSAAAQVKTDLSSSTIAFMGDATTTNYILDGEFDNSYYTIGPLPGARMYACGTQVGSGGTRPSLYAFNFSNAGVLNTAATMSDNRKITTPATNGTCSPLLELYDGTNDRLFVGVSGSDQVTMWDITAPITAASNPTATATGLTGGTSGFAIDNFSALPQASSIYFGTLAQGTTQCGSGNYCAVKLTQSALQ